MDVRFFVYNLFSIYDDTVAFSGYKTTSILIWSFGGQTIHKLTLTTLLTVLKITVALKIEYRETALATQARPVIPSFTAN